MLAFTLAAAKAPPVLEALDEDDPGPYDEWDKNSVDYHRNRSVAAAFGSQSSSYGINDLSYYGSFVNLGGCGSLWRPYFASAAWDPFGNGVWAWYPGAGYSWVSLYPWGWTPFHSGSWQYCGSGAGWGWQPGGAWLGLANQRRYPSGYGPGGIRRPGGPIVPIQNPVRPPGYPKPPRPPQPGQATLTLVSIRPLEVSRFDESKRFVFHNDSAGLGVPRSGFGNLGKVSRETEAHGFVASTRIQPAAVRPAPGTPGRIPARHGASRAGLGASPAGSSGCKPVGYKPWRH